MSCRTSSPSTPPPARASSPLRRPRTKCSWRALPTATAPRCTSSTRRHNVRVYRFILRIVRDGTTAEDLVSQVFLDVWRTAGQFEGRSQVSTWLLSIARFKALTALRQRRFEDIDQDDVRRDRRRVPIRRKPRSTAATPARSCAPASQSCRPRIARSSTSSTTMRSRWRRSAQIIGIPQSTVKTRMFYARKQLADLLKGAGVDSLAA